MTEQTPTPSTARTARLRRRVHKAVWAALVAQDDCSCVHHKTERVTHVVVGMIQRAERRAKTVPHA